jgi:hypothetical protein
LTKIFEFLKKNERNFFDSKMPFFDLEAKQKKFLMLSILGYYLSSYFINSSIKFSFLSLTEKIKESVIFMKTSYY